MYSKNSFDSSTYRMLACIRDSFTWVEVNIIRLTAGVLHGVFRGDRIGSSEFLCFVNVQPIFDKFHNPTAALDVQVTVIPRYRVTRSAAWGIFIHKINEPILS